MDQPIVTSKNKYWCNMRVYMIIAQLVIGLINVKVCSSTGKLSVQLISYMNDGSRLKGGSCCDNVRWCVNECDNYFIICVTEIFQPKCNLGKVRTKVLGDDNFNFPGIGGDLGNGHRNPLVFNFGTWKGSTLSIDIWDDEDSAIRGVDDYVDILSLNIPNTPDPDLKSANTTQKVIKSTSDPDDRYLKLRFQLYCDANFLLPDCSRECLARDDDKGHYTCDYVNGLIKCNKNWYGARCTKYCVPRQDSHAHYTCDNSGEKNCSVNWFGGNCSSYCKGSNNDTGHYSCDEKTGSKVCLPFWFGGDCLTFCSAQDDEEGHHSCNPKTGGKLCLQNWFGVNCTKYCLPQDNPLGHFLCDITGNKVCLAGWEGDNCTDKIKPTVVKEKTTKFPNEKSSRQSDIVYTKTVPKTHKAITPSIRRTSSQSSSTNNQHSASSATTISSNHPPVSSSVTNSPIYNRMTSLTQSMGYKLSTKITKTFNTTSAAQNTMTTDNHSHPTVNTITTGNHNPTTSTITATTTNNHNLIITSSTKGPISTLVVIKTGDTTAMKPTTTSTTILISAKQEHSTKKHSYRETSEDTSAKTISALPTTTSIPLINSLVYGVSRVTKSNYIEKSVSVSTDNTNTVFIRSSPSFSRPLSSMALKSTETTLYLETSADSNHFWNRGTTVAIFESQSYFGKPTSIDKTPSSSIQSINVDSTTTKSQNNVERSTERPLTTPQRETTQELILGISPSRTSVVKSFSTPSLLKRTIGFVVYLQTKWHQDNKTEVESLLQYNLKNAAYVKETNTVHYYYKEARVTTIKECYNSASLFVEISFATATRILSEEVLHRDIKTIIERTFDTTDIILSRNSSTDDQVTNCEHWLKKHTVNKIPMVLVGVAMLCLTVVVLLGLVILKIRKRAHLSTKVYPECSQMTGGKKKRISKKNSNQTLLYLEDMDSEGRETISIKSNVDNSGGLPDIS